MIETVMTRDYFERSTSKVVGDVLVIGVGFCGGAVANELQRRGYESFYINTAVSDFTNLEQVTEEMIFPIPKSKGCDKDQEKALQLISPYVGDILIHTEENYTKYKHFIFVAGAGGGTGGGTVSALAEYFHTQGKKTSIIGVLPSKEESKKNIQNAIRFMKEVDSRCREISSILYLDNTTVEDKRDINLVLAEQIDFILSLSEYSVVTTNTNMKATDAPENLGLLSVAGYVHIDKVVTNDNESSLGTSVVKANKAPVPRVVQKRTEKAGNYILEPFAYGVECSNIMRKEFAIAISLTVNLYPKEDGGAVEFDPSPIVEKYGKPSSDIKLGYNASGSTYVYVFGTEPSQDLIDRYAYYLDEIEQDEMKREKNRVELEFSEIQGETKDITIKEKSVTDIFGTPKKPQSVLQSKKPDIFKKPNPFPLKK